MKQMKSYPLVVLAFFVLNTLTFAREIPKYVEALPLEVETIRLPNVIEFSPDGENFEYAVEVPLRLESWMLDDFHWGVATEKELELQEWMLDNKHFQLEPEMKLEDWMLDEKHWN